MLSCSQFFISPSMSSPNEASTKSKSLLSCWVSEKASLRSSGMFEFMLVLLSCFLRQSRRAPCPVFYLAFPHTILNFVNQSTIAASLERAALFNTSPSSAFKEMSDDGHARILSQLISRRTNLSLLPLIRSLVQLSHHLLALDEREQLRGVGDAIEQVNIDHLPPVVRRIFCLELLTLFSMYPKLLVPKIWFE